ncbi:LO6 [Micropterus dolomieu adomavirus 2]|uniref:LO6 n=1 Tax=Micropterus dolomieu adomavirus 2 TaxID=2681676 RepID=A0A650BUI1_9VIRU|nr:LO6 [Micropterus dolomieu adomavirus 2]
MVRSGYFNRGRKTSDEEESTALQTHLIPYIDENIDTIVTMLRNIARANYSVYASLGSVQAIQRQMLKDIQSALQHVLSAQGDRGAGIGSMLTSLFQWLIPKATSLFSLIPEPVKHAAATAATDLAVTGINTLASSVKSKISPERGAGLQTCANALCQQLIQDSQYDPRGGFLGALLGALAAAAPSVISLISSAVTGKRGAGLGAYWEQWYPVQEKRKPRGGQKPAGKRKQKQNNSEPSSSPCKTVKRERGAGGQSVTLHTIPSGSFTTQCTLSVQSGSRGGRPIRRTLYCNKADIDKM